MLEFYEFNNINICIVLISTFIIYTVLCNFLQKSKKDENKFNLQYIIISIIFAIIISFIVSYILTGHEEQLLITPYWEPE